MTAVGLGERLNFLGKTVKWLNETVTSLSFYVAMFFSTHTL